MLPDSSNIVIGIGELLWDLLPEGKQLGGAPANFAYWSTVLGERGVVASRVGADEPGREAIECLARAGVDSSQVQLDRLHPTGAVRVEVSASGQPDFTVAQSVAWDFIGWTSEWRELASGAAAVCFGSLAQRSPASRKTIVRFVDAAAAGALIVFDVNLRQSFHSEEVLVQSLNRSRVAKLNSSEFPVVMNELGLSYEGELASARRLIHDFDLELVCVTRADRGSLLVTDTDSVEHLGFKVDVVDTVGAGDAFTAALVHHYLRGASLETISEAG
ncbi:MAG TPA: PfkB family carbohydrate kinase, partial [Blastocatellia bacterium]|nr:PfkB family carbohydrate kinase [Blastocatellia bacterium]